MITAVRPQLVAPPSNVRPVLEFYSRTFSAEIVHHSAFSKSGNQFEYAVVKVGTGGFSISDYISGGVPPPLEPPQFFLRLESSDPNAALEKATAEGFEVLEPLTEDPCRPGGHLAATLKDRFGHFWILGSSAAKAAGPSHKPVQHGGAGAFAAVTPSLYVPMKRGLEAVQLYTAALGAKLGRHTVHQQSTVGSPLPTAVGCYELQFGSTSLFLTDLPIGRCSRTFLEMRLEIECWDCRAVGSLASGCCRLTSDDVLYRPGVRVQRIIDPFDYSLQLTTSTGGSGDGGFLDDVYINVLLINTNEPDLDRISGLIDRYEGTPHIVSCVRQSSALQVHELLKGETECRYDLVFIDSRTKFVARDLREEKSYGGTIVGICDFDDPRVKPLVQMEMLIQAGCDLAFPKPLTFEILTEILKTTVSKWS